ncbi:MAG: hypothetical protein LBL41_03330 [Bifidobacteriaceae bacterium]|jgi:hypothetical protein|nr:hypothetical protein [Bifidobacteriaceae bacterium]
MSSEKKHSYGVLGFFLGLLVAGVAYVAISKTANEDDPWADPWEKASEPVEPVAEEEEVAKETK